MMEDRVRWERKNNLIIKELKGKRKRT